jgi:hydroxypyruvate reductase/glycerate 2-kinase
VSDVPSTLRDHARAIWQSAVAAVDPFTLVRDLLADPPADLSAALADAGRVIVVGGGKAGAEMAAGAEAALADRLGHVVGVVNVPAGAVRPLSAVRLHAARPDGSNHPTAEGVAGVREILTLVRTTTPDDVCLCLLSGGGSALMPAPAEGLTLADKQQVTQLLHACGATIGEMNCVRKHLSAFKGGRLAEAFFAAGGRHLFTLVISDVVGDPLDVIASGPTVPDPTTFTDALAVLEKYDLVDRVPAAVLAYLCKGRDGAIADTPKSLPGSARTLVVGNNARALAAAERTAESLGYRTMFFGTSVVGEARDMGAGLAGTLWSMWDEGKSPWTSLCILAGGETTVTLPPDHGRGGRNQEFVLAALVHLRPARLRNKVILSGGTDGEDGPTDAAGAIGDAGTLERAARLGFDAAAFLARHDAYSFFDATGDLLRTGLTGTNVMDVHVLLASKSPG